MSRFYTPAFVGAIVILIALGMTSSSDEPIDAPHRQSRLHVTSAGDTAILLDDTKMKTWILHRSEDPADSPVWIPIKMLDDQAAPELLGDAPKRERLLELRKRLDQMIDLGTYRLYKQEAESLRTEIAKLEAELDD